MGSDPSKLYVFASLFQGHGARSRAPFPPYPIEGAAGSTQITLWVTCFQRLGEKTMTKGTSPVLMAALGMLLPVWRMREIGCPGSKHPEHAAYDRDRRAGQDQAGRQAPPSPCRIGLSAYGMLPARPARCGSAAARQGVVRRSGERLLPVRYRSFGADLSFGAGNEPPNVGSMADPQDYREEEEQFSELDVAPRIKHGRRRGTGDQRRKRGITEYRSSREPDQRRRQSIKKFQKMYPTRKYRASLSVLVFRKM